MDNLCHTLTGAALAEAGLKAETRFGSAALMIAANLPDIDVLAFMTDTPSVALRRGWTHGILAQATLPIVLTGAFVLIDRWRRPPAGGSRVNAASMLLLCYAGVLSHVGMDWLNNYGVRLLMPWSSRWFYGDAVFIVDPWLWLALAGGAILARRGRSVRIARIALLLAVVYIAALTLSARGAREYVRGEWAARNGRPPVSLMVGPVPVSPFRKAVIVDAGDHYQRGTFTWFPRRVAFEPGLVPKRATEPAALQASLTPEFQAILVWSRFPYYELTKSEDGGTRVMVADMRFGPRLFHATVTVPNR